MTSREEFGSFVLLKKLAEDPLGETFRAAKLGQQGMERVVLLKVFNGAGVDSDTLRSRIAERAALPRVLSSPNIGSGVDSGEVQGVPYVAYDYISGKDLNLLMHEAARQRSPIPADHALLIAERLALGIAVGYETRLDGERLLHGFIVPQLVMVSNEGEIRLLGFEASRGLREVALSAETVGEFARYLSPETLTGAAPSKTDDVYSLGAILFELLTGKRLPTGPAAGLVEGATLADGGAPLPPDVADLLRRSLGLAESRIGDAVQWHKAISRLMAEGNYNATTFNLAFFMHNLLREDIEREGKEIEVEQTLVLPASEARTQAISPADLAEAMREDESSATAYAVAGGDERSGKKGLIIGLAAALVVVGIGSGAVWYLNRDRAEPPPAVAAPPAVTEVAEPELPADAVADGEQTDEVSEADDLREQLNAMLDEKTAAMEASLRDQYDRKIRELQRQLEEAQQVIDDEPAEPPSKADNAATAQPPAGGQADLPTTKSANGGTAAAAKPADPKTTSTAGVRQPAAGGAAPVTQPPASSAAGGGAPAAKPAAQRPAGAGQPDAGEEAKSARETTKKAEPPPRQPVKVGTLVQPGPGVIPPKLARRVDPRYPQIARRLNKTARVVVKVLVDEVGKVAQAEIQGEKVGFGFDEAALTAAKGSRFEPATKDGVRVKMWAILSFRFQP